MPSSLKRKFAYLAGFILIGGVAFYGSSASSGTVTCGSGTAPTKPMPVSGSNFSSYCLPCIAALRTYGREPVIDTVVAAYAATEKSHPQTLFLYGEIGFPDGGRFRPHRTHREGLSVDLMVPLEDRKIMQTGVTNRYGYDIEFSSKGDGDDGKIDFNALAALISNLGSEAGKRGGKVRRIFFAPDLQPLLMVQDGTLFSKIRFNKKQSWVRHDDHIHVDFDFPCP